MNRREQDQARRDRGRAREADRLEGELEQLDRRRDELRATIRRLRGPVDVAALVARAESGVALTQSELAILAAEQPDAFNRAWERGAA